jgi:glycine dehydrogenase subunit 1
LISKVESIPGVHVLFSGPGFHEVVLQLDCEVSAILRTMSAHGIQAGYDLSLDYPELSNCLLVCATETKTDADIQRYAELLERVVGLQSKAPCPVKPKFA